MNISIQIEDNIECSNDYEMDEFVAKQLDYEENYTLSDLKKIADYYEISTRKLKKNELIQEIVIFERDPENGMIYNQRIQAWFWINELRKDDKLKQYILF